jgi:putative flippase GtrA
MEAGVRLFDMSPLAARLAGVAAAMVAAWLSHRYLTFAMTTRPSFGEFGRYVASASTTAVINYGAFAALLFVWPALPRLAALAAASCLATIFSYLSMRYGVFRRI